MPVDTFAIASAISSSGAAVRAVARATDCHGRSMITRSAARPCPRSAASVHTTSTVSAISTATTNAGENASRAICVGR